MGAGQWARSIFSWCKEIKQQGGKTRFNQNLGDSPITWAMAATATSMGKQDESQGA